MLSFLKSLLPYTRKAWAALVGTLIALALVVVQSDDLWGWAGTLPSPWNQLVLAVIPMAVAWLVKEQRK
jgi:Na+/H+ antiporter NhaD/arsenite permease-like protein